MALSSRVVRSGTPPAWLPSAPAGPAIDWGLSVTTRRRTHVLFVIWIGIFNNSVIAQFWSFANDVYTPSAGERLFPIIVVGMTAGAPVGSPIVARLFAMGIDPYMMMQLGALSVVISLFLYIAFRRLVAKRETEKAAA